MQLEFQKKVLTPSELSNLDISTKDIHNYIERKKITNLSAVEDILKFVSSFDDPDLKVEVNFRNAAGYDMSDLVITLVDKLVKREIESINKRSTNEKYLSLAVVKLNLVIHCCQVYHLWQIRNAESAT